MDIKKSCHSITKQLQSTLSKAAKLPGAKPVSAVVHLTLGVGGFFAGFALCSCSALSNTAKFGSAAIRGNKQEIVNLFSSSKKHRIFSSGVSCLSYGAKNTARSVKELIQTVPSILKGFYHSALYISKSMSKSISKKTIRKQY